MPVFNSICLKMRYKTICYYQFNNQFNLYSNSTRLWNSIDYVLTINEMQKLIIEKLLYNFSNIPNFNYDWIKDLLLLYICSNSRVRKNRVVHIIKLKWFLLMLDSDLVITIWMNATIDNLGHRSIYTSFIIGIKNKHRNSNIVSNL